MRRPSHFGRRLFLGGMGVAGAAAASGPVLRSLGGVRGGTPAARAADGFPKRFVVWFTPNGSIKEEWFPQSGGETDFALGRILRPLEDAGFRDKLILMSGLDMVSTRYGPGDGHQKGMGHMLTGVELEAGDVLGGCDTCEPAGLAGGISIDQLIANQIAGDTPFRSRELGIRSNDDANAWTRMSYTGPGEALPAENNPADAFGLLFGDRDIDPEEELRRRAMRRSVVDSVKGDFGSLEGKLSGEDRQRLESHYESVLSIEKRLGLIGTCALPEVGDFVADPRSNANLPTVMEQQIRIGVMAMACDLTRVVSFQISNSVGNNVLSFLNASGNSIQSNHHSLSHQDEALPYDHREALTVINTWYAQQFAFMLELMASVREGDGTMLDNTAIIWVNELAEGAPHNHDNMPFLIAGSAGGALRTGRYVQFNTQPYTGAYQWRGIPHNNLWVTLAQAYGVDINTFGDARACTGAAPNLLT